MKQLSIIVPVYNVEPYLERCIRSLEDQNIAREELEVICINDGSSDNSRGIIIALQQEFRNITLVDQHNQGVSAARNKGIEMASGRYLMMVDSDDFLVSGCLGERMKLLELKKPDIAYAGHRIVDSNMKEKYSFNPQIDDEEPFTGINYINQNMKGRSEIRAPHSSVGIFYRTEFIRSNNLLYLEGVPFLEDGEFLARVNCLAEKVIYLKGVLYVICKRPGSATTSKLYYSDRSRSGFLSAAKHLYKFREERCDTEIQRAFMNQHIVQFTILYLISYPGFKYLFHYHNIYEMLKKEELKKLDTVGCSSFYSRLGRSYNLSIHCFYLVWRYCMLSRSVTLKYQRIRRLLGIWHLI